MTYDSYGDGKKLIQEGFTAKEMALLKERIEKDTTTYQPLLIDMKRRFIVCVTFLAVFVVIYGFGFYINTDGDYFSLSVTVIMVFAVMWFVVPLKSGAKSYLFIRKNN